MRAFAVKQKSHRQTAPAKWTISDGAHSEQRDAVNHNNLIPIVAQVPAKTQSKLAANTPEHVSEHETDLIADQEPTSGASRPDTGQLFGHDFSRVSVHAKATSTLELLHHARNALMGSLGERAGRIAIETASTKTKGAEGLTVDRRVHLAPGRFDTQSYEGRVRLGHEVAHAIQQERGAGLSSALAPAHRTALEMESEEAGRAFAGGRRCSVMGKAPTTVPLFRGPGEEEEPAAERELDAAFQQVLDKQAARGAAIERYRKERKDYISAHLEYREYDVPVDARLRKMPAGQQQQELWMRVLQMEFPSIAREDAEEILRRTGMKTWSVESDTVAEQIRKRDKIHFRTKFMRLLVEVYNEIVEDRVRASLNVDELLNPGPDMALEIFKDVGRGYYNGILGFAQGLVDLPAAPVNLFQSLRGGEQKHILDLSGLRADYHTSYGIHYGSSIELGTQLGLTVVSGKLPVGAGAGTGAAASTASQASRAMRLFAIWSKLNAVSAGATAVVQAGQAIRDIARGYVIEDGKKRPLTEDDILGRLAGIAFGLHAAKSALRGAPEKPGSASSTPEPDVTDVTIERATSSKIQVSVPGEPGKIAIDATWRVLAPDGQVLGQGSPDQGALLGSKLGEAQTAQHAPPATTEAPPSPDTSSRQTAQTPRPATTLSVLQGGGQYSGKPRGLAFDADQPSRSVRVDTSHPIFKNRQAANEQDVPPSPQAKAMQVGVPPAREAVDMPKETVLGTPPAGDTVQPAQMGRKPPPPSSPEVGKVSSDVQPTPGGKAAPEPTPTQSSPVRQVYDLRGNPIPQQEFGTPGVPGGPDRVFIVPAQGDNAPQVHVVRGGKEQSFTATNRTLEQQQKRGFIASEPESDLLSVEELQGKRVLDLAAGTEGQTVRDLRELGIDAQGMDIALSESARQTGYLERADIATTVPFKGQFDIAFELFGGLAYDLGEHTGAAFQNAISRVKPGGTLYLAPLAKNAQAALRPYVEDLVARGGSVKKTPYSLEDEIWRITLPPQSSAPVANQ